MTRARSTIVFNHEDARVFTRAAEDAGQLAQQRILAEPVAHPGLGIDGQGRGVLAIIHAEQNDGDARVGTQAAQEGQNLPAVHAVERGVEQDGFDAIVGRGQCLFHGGGFNHAVAVAGKHGGDVRAAKRGWRRPAARCRGRFPGRR